MKMNIPKSFEDIKYKSRKTLQKMVLKMSESLSPSSSVAVADPPVILAPQGTPVSLYIGDPLDNVVVRHMNGSVFMIVQLQLDEDVFDHLRTVCDGRGQTFSDCISQNLKFSRDNGFI